MNYHFAVCILWSESKHWQNESVKTAKVQNKTVGKKIDKLEVWLHLGIVTKPLSWDNSNPD